MSGDEELMKWKAEKEAARAVSALRSGHVVWCGVCVGARSCVRLCFSVSIYIHMYTHIHVYIYT